MLFTLNYASPFGNIRLTSDGEFLIGVKTEFEKDGCACLQKTNIANKTDNRSFPFCLRQAQNWLDIYFRGDIPHFLPPLKPHGTSFQLAVWRCLQDVPYGTLTTYGAIAKQIAHDLECGKMSAQAVGRAVGSNPIGIIIPCHRVIGSNGNLTGYAGGLEYKVKLLELEGADCSKLKMPKKSPFL